MTLKCIAGIEKPDAGRIVSHDTVLYDSIEGINLPPQKRKVGYLFQSYALFPNMTVAENIGFALEGKRDRERIVKEYIAKLRLDGLENNYPSQLSGGQQQRTALARLLAVDAEIIMFDEPLSALDSFLKWELEQEFLDLFANCGKPILYVSHDRGEVYRLCDRITVLEKGEIVSCNLKQELFEKPQTVTGAILTGCKNISSVLRGDGRNVLAKDWGVVFKLPEGVDEAAVRFTAVHAHQATFGNKGENVFNARIVKIIEDVFDLIVLLKLSPKAEKTFRWIVPKADAQFLEENVQVEVSINIEDVIFLER